VVNKNEWNISSDWTSFLFRNYNDPLLPNLKLILNAPVGTDWHIPPWWNCYWALFLGKKTYNLCSSWGGPKGVAWPQAYRAKFLLQSTLPKKIKMAYYGATVTASKEPGCQNAASVLGLKSLPKTWIVPMAFAAAVCIFIMRAGIRQGERYIVVGCFVKQNGDKNQFKQ